MIFFAFHKFSFSNLAGLSRVADVKHSMNNRDVLAARVPVLENYIAGNRYRNSQPGPEKDVAEKALTMTHTNLKRLKEFLVGEPNDRKEV